MNIKKFLQSHYSFLILSVTFLTLAVGVGVQSTFGVFFIPMSKEFGWNRATTSGPFTLYVVVYGLLSIIFGRLSDRVRAWKLITCGAVILGSGFILMSTTRNIWQLYIYYGILVAVGIGMMFVPLTSLVVKWFDKRRGLMSGIAISGVGFGIALFPPITSQLIVSYKWRNAELYLGIATVVLILLLAQLLRIKPESKAPEEKLNKPNKRLGLHDNGLSFKEAVKTKQFWLIVIAWFFNGFFYYIPIVHIVPYAGDLKMPAVAAATIMTTIGLVGIFGRISLGYIADKLTNRVTLSLSFAVTGLAFLCLALSPTVWMLYIFAVVFGLLFGVGILIVPTVAEYFGIREVGTISGMIVAASSLGGAFGPSVAGVIYDTTNTYMLAFILCAAAGITAGLFIWLLKATRANR